MWTAPGVPWGCDMLCERCGSKAVLEAAVWCEGDRQVCESAVWWQKCVWDVVRCKEE